MIEKYTGIDADYIILGILVVVCLLFVLLFIMMIQISGLKKKYNYFMKGESGKSLEDILVLRMKQTEELLKINQINEDKIDRVTKMMASSFQKIGVVKYDAFNEMGGKLSFSMALLNNELDGFVLNAVHSREGCYTYVKEIIGGNSVLVLSEEEKKALNMAKGIENNAK